MAYDSTLRHMCTAVFIQVDMVLKSDTIWNINMCSSSKAKKDMENFFICHSANNSLFIWETNL